MKLNPSISLFFIISSMHAATYMEQTQQWISWGSTRRLVPAGQQLLFDSQASMPAVAPFYRGQSWEEKAFAEDSAGLLMWPPRSYSCNFCAREFRSAQALGGHMNVHRRDRARLKQSYAGELDEDHPRIISSHVASSSSGALEDCENDDQQRKHVSATELKLGGEGLRLGFDEEEDEPRESKRLRRIINDGMVCLPLPSLAPHHHSIQELDLELRLGDGSAQE